MVSHLEQIPIHYRNLELCEYHVMMNGLNLNFVPNHLRTWSMCALAVRQNGIAIQYVPDDILQSIMICEIAIIQNNNAAEYIPVHILENMIFENNYLLNRILPKYRTINMLKFCIYRCLNIPLPSAI